MEEVIETRVSPAVVWAAWEKTHVMQTKEGKAKFRYELLDVKKGESFSLLWKTAFVRLIFTHQVLPTSHGSKIIYQVRIKGFFALLIRWLLKNKMKHMIGSALKNMVEQLENQCIK